MSKLLKTLSLRCLYAKDFIVFAGGITILTYWILLKNGLGALTAIIWFKVFTSLLGIYVHQHRKSKQIFFYMNLGLGKRSLMLFSLITDLSLWIIGIILILNR